jgi:predicted enzyme related to lactoylglutathione lyase
MKFDMLDLVVRDVPKAAAFFRDVVGLTLRVNEERYAEVESGAVTIMLTPDLMVPSDPVRGVVVHFQVEEVAAALAKAQQAGATVLLEITQTDWGTESAMIQGPDGLVVDFYRPVEG